MNQASVLSGSLMHATCLLHLTLLNFIIIIIFGEDYKFWTPTYCCFIPPNIPLSILFSNTLNLSFSLNVRDQVLHLYKTTGKIVVCIF
jgi:hypothetical protein